MKHPFLIDELILFTFYFWTQISGIHCLIDVIVSMPDAVRKDDKIRMICKYNLEGEPLYTLKWYKGEREFFRYTPKERQQTKFFPIDTYPDLDIVPEESHEAQVTIRRATSNLAGRYTCEITTDIPSLQTASGHSELRVVVLPREQALPTINRTKQKVKEGEWVELTCKSPKSIPASNLTWTVNNMPISMIRHKMPEFTKSVDGRSDLEESKSVFSFLATEKLLLGNNNSLKVRCTASIFSIYQKIHEVNFLFDKPAYKVMFSPEIRQNPEYINTEISAYNIRRSQPEDDEDRVIRVGDEEDNGESTMLKASFHIIIVAIVVITRQLL